jgi:phosphate transport system substrate-binding protein
MPISLRLLLGTGLAACALAATMLAAEPVRAAEGPLRIQGSTTFHAAIFAPYRPAIERMAGAPLDIVPNKSSWGLLALLEGRADLAMISAPLDAEIAAARKLQPNFDYAPLSEYRVLTTRIAFAVHPSNPVTRLPVETVTRLLNGQVVNWSQVGGADLAVRVVAVKEGGGTVAAVRSQILGEVSLAAGAVRLESANHVLKVVAQEPGAIGIAQLGLIRKAGLHEIETDRPVEQPLSFVTAGQPSKKALRVIDATRFATVNDRD